MVTSLKAKPYAEKLLIMFNDIVESSVGEIEIFEKCKLSSSGDHEEHHSTLESILISSSPSKSFCQSQECHLCGYAYMINEPSLTVPHMNQQDLNI